MLPSIFTVRILRRFGKAIGLAAMCAAPALAATPKSDTPVDSKNTGFIRSQICTGPAATAPRTSQLCDLLVAWSGRVGLSGPLVCIAVPALRADPTFWRQLSRADRSKLMQFDVVELADPSRASRRCTLHQPAQELVHPDPETAASYP